MKRFLKAPVILALVSIMLVLTCPDESDYKLWLQNKHDISCEIGRPDQSYLCKQGQKPIEWKSRSVQSLPFYMKVEDRYKKANKEYVVQAIGILNYFFDYSEISVQ